MSVINKMLRDLDQRQAPESAFSKTRARPDLRRGTASVDAPLALPSKARAPRWGGVLLAGAVVLGVAGWFWKHGFQAAPATKIAEIPMAVQPPTPTPTPTLALAVVPSAVAPAPALAPAAPAAPAPQSVPATEPVQAMQAKPVRPAPQPSSATVVLRMDPNLSLQKFPQAPPAAVKDVPLRAASAQPPPTATALGAPVRAPAPVSVATPAPPDPVQAAQRQQQAGKDAIAHAQSLWNAGSRDAAIELMEEVVATAERAAASGGASTGASMLVLPVRELTRMQLAQSRPDSAWALLTRLEPLLGNQADLWAVRANAAQRLGRHQDSVHAYMMALQSRPNEQRWLLGAAVSLAALGQASSAADMAEKARAVGVVSKEVLAYLRQMGVPVKEQ